MLEYRTVTQDDSEALDVEVNKGIALGWTPLGSPSVAMVYVREADDPWHFTFVQAMTREITPDQTRCGHVWCEIQQYPEGGSTGRECLRCGLREWNGETPR